MKTSQEEPTSSDTPEAAHAAERDAQLKAMRRMTTDVDHQPVIEYLYQCLSILDSKCSSLLSFNSIVMAVFAIFMTSQDLTVFQKTSIAIGTFTVLMSSLLLLGVVRITWATSEELSDLDGHVRILMDVRTSRTDTYRYAWYFSVAAVFGLGLFFGLRIGPW